MDHTINLDDLGDLPLSSGQITWTSLAPSGASLTIPVASLESIPVQWEYGDGVSIRLSGSTIYKGKIKCAYPTISATAIHFSVELEDCYADLTRKQAPPGYVRGASYSGSSMASLSEVVSTCATSASGISANMAISGIIQVSCSNGSNTYAQLIEAASRWHPSLASRVDYSAQGDVIDFVDANSSPVIDFPYASSGIMAINLKPRYDLIPPCAYLRKSGVIVATEPAGADASSVGTIGYDIPDIANTSMASAATVEAQQKMTIKGLKFPEQSLGTDEEWEVSDQAYKFWSRHMPFLAQVKETIKFSKKCAIIYEQTPEEFLVVDPVTGDESYDLPRNYAARNQRMCLVEGSITPAFPGVRWCYATIEQSVCCMPTGPLTAQVRDFFVGDGIDGANRVITRRMIYRVVAISNEATHFVGGSYSPAEEDPPPPTATADERQSLRDWFSEATKLQWDGSVELISHPAPWLLVGKKLRISSSGYVPFDNMETSIQQVSLDLFTKRVRLVCGTKSHVSLDEALSRRSLGNLRDNSAVSAGVSGAGNASGEEDPQNQNPVAPMFAPQANGAGGGERRHPFSIWVADGVKWMQGGEVVFADGNILQVPTTQLNSNTRKVKLKVQKIDNIWTPQIIQT